MNNTHRVVIIGGGFSGIGVAIRLLKAGIEDFVILEKAPVLGGTWRDNSYPGCACDVPSQLYSYSFAPNPDWGRVFAPAAEIQAYTLDVAREFGVERHVRYDTEVLASRWDEAAACWRIETSQGDYIAKVLVAGLGPLHEPKTPKIEGIEDFQGDIFHSARWKHDVDLSGKRVAVVGTGSSAIQMVPELAAEVGKLVLFQRTPAWVLPKPDHAIPPIEKAAFRYVPGFRRGYRGTIYYLLELLQLAQRRPNVMRQLQKIGLAHLRLQVKDMALREALTPSFTLGCKRLLLSNTYYPALGEDHVELVPGALTRVTANSVVGPDGQAHEVDAIVFATGFAATDPPAAKMVFGRGGESLEQVWNGSPNAYLGTTIAGFPNLFLMIGPNLGNGHSSAFVIIEAQADYIVSALEQMSTHALESVDVRPVVQARYNEQVQAALAGTVWNAGGCASWYIDKTGRNSSIYPWTTIDLRRRLARFDIERYAVRGVDAVTVAQPKPVGAIDLEGAVVAITGGARGIGLAAAQRFADAGATVCIGDLDLAEAKRACVGIGAHAHAYELDVSSRRSFAAFIDEIETEVGPIDVLVNNAGVMPTGRFLAEPDSVDAACMSVNHFGTSLGMRLVIPRMIGRGRGHVVNVASMAGKIYMAGMATYVASKHATVGLSAAVRDELRGTGVTLSTMCPGVVRTRLAAGLDWRGTFSVDADAIGRAIVDTCETRVAEVSVPGPFMRLSQVAPFLPQDLLGRVRSSVSSHRIIEAPNTGARADYEAHARAQGARTKHVVEA